MECEIFFISRNEIPFNMGLLVESCPCQSSDLDIMKTYSATIFPWQETPKHVITLIELFKCNRLLIICVLCNRFEK